MLVLVPLLVSTVAFYQLPPQNAASYTSAGANSSLGKALCAPSCTVPIDPAFLPSPVAVPGSTTLAVDVTAALNAAINNASALYAGGAPCVVQLPPAPDHPYLVSSTVRLASGVVLAGSPNATILISGLAKFNAFSLSGSPVVLASMVGASFTGSIIGVSADVAHAAASAMQTGKRIFVSAFMPNDHALLVSLEPFYSREASGYVCPLVRALE
jgi:hypothetical protein